MIYTTSAGKELPTILNIERILVSQIVTDRAATIGECQKCKMFGKGGGCPPFAPEFDKVYRDKYQFGYVVVVTIPFDRWMTDKHKEKPNPMSGAFLAANFMQVVMKPIETKMAKILATFGGQVFSAGYCGGCQKCAVKQGQPCSKPKERMFSMESTGILVSDSLEQIGLPKLDWIRYKDKYVPKYTCRVVLLLTDKEVSCSEIIDKFNEIRGITIL